MILDSNRYESVSEEYKGYKPIDEVGVMEALLEAEEFWGTYTLALAKAEHESIVSENAELLNEAVSEWVEAVKKFFKKIWDAFKSFVNWVWGEIKSVFMKKTAWVKKYKKDIEAGAKAAAMAGKSVEGWKLTADAESFSFVKQTMSNDFSKTTNSQDIQNAAYDKLKDKYDDFFSGDAKREYMKQASASISAMEAFGTAKVKDVFNKGQKEIKKAEAEAIKAANTAKDAKGDTEVQEAAKADVEKINGAKRNAKHALRVMQLDYSTMKKIINYHFAFCKKCFTYKTFGTRTPKEESGNILDRYM